MNWRYILWQGIFTCVTAVFIWIIVPTRAELLQTNGDVIGPQGSAGREKEAAPATRQAVLSKKSPDHAAYQISPETISRLISIIEQLQDTISELTLRVDDLSKQKTPALPLPSMAGGAMPFPPPTTMPNPLGWIQKLPDDKRARVQEAFKDNAAIVRERIHSLPRDRSGGQEFAEIIREGNEDLSARLELILSPEEYREYQRSRPPIPADMGAMK